MCFKYEYYLTLEDKSRYTVYAIYFAGFLFSRILRVGCICEFNNTWKIYLRYRGMNATPGMRLVYAILVVQYTVHVQMSEWYWFLRPLLSSLIANLTTRENVLKSRFVKN